MEFRALTPAIRSLTLSFFIHQITLDKVGVERLGYASLLAGLLKECQKNYPKIFRTPRLKQNIGFGMGFLCMSE